MRTLDFGLEIVVRHLSIMPDWVLRSVIKQKPGLAPKACIGQTRNEQITLWTDAHL